MYISFSIVKFLIAIVFGAICGGLSGLFITRSHFQEMIKIQDNDEDLSFYSGGQMSKYGSEFQSSVDKRRKKLASENAKFIAMLVGAVVAWALVVVLLFTQSTGVGPKRDAVANLGQGEIAEDENKTVKIKTLPVMLDADGRLVVPYEITNKSTMTMKNSSITVLVNNNEVSCFKGTLVEGSSEAEPKIKEIEEPIVGGSTEKYYIVIDTTSLKKAGVKSVSKVSMTFVTYTENFENNGAIENETSLTIVQNVVNQ